MKRPDKIDYYLEIAKVVAKRGTCLRRLYGAVLVKNDEIIATGYNGSPRGMLNCIDTGECMRQQLKCKPGERYELCEAVHAEQNCVISAARRDAIFSVLYLTGIDAETGEVIEAKPCMLCARQLLNAGVSKVIGSLPDGGYREIYLERYIKQGCV